MLAQQQSLADSQLHSANNKLLLDHHIVQQTGSGLLAPSSPFFQSRSITFDVSSPNILAPQPIKHSLGKFLSYFCWLTTNLYWIPHPKDVKPSPQNVDILFSKSIVFHPPTPSFKSIDIYWICITAFYSKPPIYRASIYRKPDLSRKIICIL